MSIPKKHHYVPRFILRRFVSGKGEQVWAFDKTTGRTFSANIADVAAENALYDFDIGEASATLEPALAAFESEASLAYRRVLERDSLEGLTREDRVLLATLIAHLLLRSPQKRAQLRDLVGQLRDRVWKMGTDPDRLEQLRILDANEEKLSFAKSLPSLLEQIVPVLIRKTWIFHHVAAPLRLLISDNPVTMHNDRSHNNRGNLGLAVAGIQVYWPLSIDRCLALYCPTDINEFDAAYRDYNRRLLRGEGPPAAPPILAQLLNSRDTGAAMPMSPEAVELVNSLQVWNAERFLYSSCNDFEMAREMIASHPSLRQGPRLQS